MTLEMAPSTSVQHAASGRDTFGAQKSNFEEEVKQRRLMLGLGSRARGRKSNGNRIGRDGNEDNGHKMLQKRQLFDPLGRLNNRLQGAAAEAGRIFDGFVNPARPAPPVTSVTPVPPPSSTAAQDIAPAQPTSAPPAPPSATPTPTPPPPPPVVVPPSPQPPQTEKPPQTTQSPSPQVTTPSTTTPAATSTFLTIPPAIAITAEPVPTNPTFLVPVDFEAPIPQFDIPLDSAPTVTPQGKIGLLPSAGSESTNTRSTVRFTPLATPTTIQIDKDAKPEPRGGISPSAERFLIGAGVICVLVALILGLLLFLKKRRGETLAMFIRRKSSKNGANSENQDRQHRIQSYVEPPPKYSSEPEPFDYVAVEKRIPIQPPAQSFYTPGPPPPLSIPVNIAAIPKSYSPQQQGISPLSTNSRSVMPSYYAQRTLSQDLYGVSPQSARPAIKNFAPVFQHSGQHQGPQDPYSVNSSPQRYNNLFSPDNYSASTHNGGEFASSYNNTGTQNTLLTSQTSNLNDPAQQANNRVSTLSSLSSGFGDGLNIQDNVTIKYTNPGQQQRKSKGQRMTRFSWQTTTSKALGTDRASTYTTTSVDTAPRFRSVNSWVAQQTGRVEREQMMAAQIPAMPPIPATLQRSVAPIKKHQRQESDISAFNYHPGQEIQIAPGSRVASSVLDRKIGHISRSTLG